VLRNAGKPIQHNTVSLPQYGNATAERKHCGDFNKAEEIGTVFYLNLTGGVLLYFNP
jgi:hypothetical protein